MSVFLRDRDDPRARKLLTLVLVCLTSCVLPTPFYLWMGMTLPLLSNLMVCGIGVTTLLLIRHGARVATSASVFLLGVLVVVAPFGLMASRDFALLIFAWLTLYPLSASALGGPGSVCWCSV